MCYMNIREIFQRAGITNVCIQLCDAGKAGRDSNLCPNHEPGGETDLKEFWQMYFPSSKGSTWGHMIRSVQLFDIFDIAFTHCEPRSCEHCKILSWTCADRDMLGGISQATGSLWKEKRFCWYGNTVDTVVFVFPSPHLSLSLSTSSSPSDDYHLWIIFYGSLSIYSAGLQRQKQRGGGRMDEKTGETLREAAGSIQCLGEWKDVFN